MPLLVADRAEFVLVGDYSFSNNVEVRLVGAESQHNQVGVGAVDAVAGVGVVPVLGTLGADELENFMFSFSWDVGI